MATPEGPVEAKAQVKVPERRKEKIPLEGPGPHGVPETYYTSHVLNSTGRYARFVKKLRATEEMDRKRYLAKRESDLDNMSNEFFIRCDRRALINNVERRVKLCLESYEDDLKAKKGRLRELLMKEEEDNIRKFVMQAQAGAEMIWQDKKDRLAFLLAKRKKEHEDKFKATPLTKCTEVLPAVYKQRLKEAQEIQLYQMKENQARRESERELEKMWHEISLKECEALEARMEYEAIERKRRDLECKANADEMLALQRENREKERERLRQEVEWLKGVWEEENRQDREAQKQVRDNRMAAAEASRQIMAERAQYKARKDHDDKMVADTWDQLCQAGIAADQASMELRRTKEKELVTCNRKLVEMQRELASLDTAKERLIGDIVKRNREAEDKIRCEYVNRVNKNNKDCRDTMMQQIEDRKKRREELRQQMLEQDAYDRSLQKQLDELVINKEKVDAEKRKQHQRQLLRQMEYNQLLKERALAEEADQVRKFQKATEDYHAEIKEMLARPSYSEQIHPFMKQMAKGIKMREKCPCSSTNYCK